MQGNPIAEKEKYMNKVCLCGLHFSFFFEIFISNFGIVTWFLQRRCLLQIRTVLPNLRVFNSKPVDKCAKDGKSDVVDNDSALTADKKLETKKLDNHDSCDVDMKKKLKEKRHKTNDSLLENEVLIDEEDKRNQLKKKKSKDHVPDQSEFVHLEEEARHRSEKKKGKLQKRGLLQNKDDTEVKNTNAKRGELNSTEKTERGSKKRASQVANLDGGLATFPANKKKAKKAGLSELRSYTTVMKLERVRLPPDVMSNDVENM